MKIKSTNQKLKKEITLDPDNWEEFSKLGHRMVDDMINHLQSLNDKPAWQPVPAAKKAKFKGNIPHKGIGEEKAYQEFLSDVLPWPTGNFHPRFWGWVQGTGFPLAMMADMLASGLNPHMAGFDQAPALVEKQVTKWMIELAGLPAKSSGILVSGGTMANLTSIIVARNSMAGYDIRNNGVDNSSREKMIIYGANETHKWVETAAEMLGLGRNSFSNIPVDNNYKINCSLLEKTINSDIQKGHKPFCIVGNAGTVNTGAVDNLKELSRISKKYKLWFHVDGAFGALINLVDEFRYLLEGMNKADSIAFDLHKWMYFPYEIGCALFRDEQKHLNAFKGSASYLKKSDRGIMAGGLPFADRGIELSRGFKALKVWMGLKAYGTDKFAAIIKQNIEQARYLASLIKAHKELELSAPVELNIVCFRFAPAGIPENKLNKINQELLIQIQEKGIAVPSGTNLGTRFVLRVAIVNHRSKYKDFELLVNETIKIGKKLIKQVK